ncbi:hypothetical protein [Streptomyces sp. NPDC048252]|uniref:hypothetical protein n=1 Tax=Streptomyces sp. NPDC048252 TaxID=3154612 RepID=UPI00341C99B0
MNAQPEPADIAAMREDGDLEAYLRALTGRVPKQPKPAAAEPNDPGYHIARPGAWPCGTAATGPTPPPCTHPTA